MDNTNFQILILDDDSSLGDLLRVYLETSGPFQITQIFAGRDLLPTLEEKQYHLLLLDFQLPDTTGLDVLSILSAKNYHLPVIMMSGKGDQRTAAQAIQRGASDYLIKGDDILSNLPGLIRRTIHVHELQEAARRSMEEVQYQALLLDNMRDAVVVWNLEGEITFWNPAAYILFGLKPQAMIGQSVNDVYLNMFNPPFVINRSENTSALETEREYIRKDGRKIWIGSRLMPLRSPDRPQTIVGFMDVVRDITRRKKVQQDLLESQNFVQKVIDTTPNLIFIFDLANGMEFINQKASEMLGYSTLELIDMNLKMLRGLVHPDDIEGVIQKQRSVLKAADGVVVESEFRCRHKNKQWRWLSCRQSIFSRQEYGRPKQILSACLDITDRKIKDARIQQANARLTHAAQLTAIGQLATGVAHQVSNPLTAILGETQLLLRSLDKDDPIRESVELIETAGWRAQWAVQTLNTFSEPPSNMIGIVDLYETVQLAISLIGVNLQAGGVTINLVLDENTPKLRGNPRQIEALWVNLLLFFRSIINNSGCSINIQSVDSDVNQIEIDFILNGATVSENQLNTVFDEDLVVNSDNTISGMEFSLCQEIVRQNQGSIEVNSDCSQSVFRIMLPRER